MSGVNVVQTPDGPKDWPAAFPRPEWTDPEHWAAARSEEAR